MKYDRAYHLNLREFNRLKRRYELAWAYGAGWVFMTFLYDRMVDLKKKALPSVRLPSKLH